MKCECGGIWKDKSCGDYPFDGDFFTYKQCENCFDVRDVEFKKANNHGNVGDK